MGVWASDVHIIPADRARSEPWWQGLDGKIRRGEPFLDQIPAHKIRQHGARAFEDDMLRAKGVRHADGREDTTIHSGGIRVVLPAQVREELEKGIRDGKIRSVSTPRAFGGPRPILGGESRLQG